MSKIINLEDLLQHAMLDLYSVEEQIMEALPSMISKVSDNSLKEVLTEHLDVTKRQKERLDTLKKVLFGDQANEEKNFFTKLFGGNKKVTSKGMEGLIKEAEQIMEEDMEPATMDAAIIGAAQKIEHYEIAGYGTACAYARELNKEFIAEELVKTLMEELNADKALSTLAMDDINVSAALDTDTVTDDNGESFDTIPSGNLNIDEMVIDKNLHAKPGVDHLATSPIVGPVDN